MKSAFESILSKALIIAFAVLGFMIVHPITACADDLECLSATIVGPASLHPGDEATYTITYTFNVNDASSYSGNIYEKYRLNRSDCLESMAENYRFEGNSYIITVTYKVKENTTVSEGFINAEWGYVVKAANPLTIIVPTTPTPTPRTRPRDDDDDDSHEESRTSVAEPSWTPEKAAATIVAEKAAKQQAAETQQAAVQTLLRTLATTKPTDGVGEARKVIVLDMTKVDILDPATVNLLTLNSKFEYYIKISDVGGLTTTVKIPANFNYRPFIKADGTMNIHEVLWSIVKSRIKKATPKGSLYMIR